MTITGIFDNVYTKGHELRVLNGTLILVPDRITAGFDEILTLPIMPPDPLTTQRV